MNKLKTKCLTSNFNPKLVENQFKKIFCKSKNENVLIEEKDITKNKNVYWSTQFKKLLSFTKEETKLFPSGKISFKKPASLRKLLNNYSQIAKQKQRKAKLSKKCDKCALCGNHGKHKNMVFDKEILNLKGKTIKLKQNLNCKS